MLEKKHIIIIILILIITVFVIGIIFVGTGPTETLQINDINIEQDQFNIYNLKGHVTALKDFDYLEARIVFYDNNGVVIGSAHAWNINNVHKGDVLSLGNGLGGVCDGTPAYAVVSFFDSVYGDKAIANATITFNANSTKNATVDSSSGSSAVSSGNSNAKYTDADLKSAEQSGYNNGYSDAIDDSNLNYDNELDVFYDNDGKIVSSSDESYLDIETTTD